ncbi:glutathione-disulfide reductase [Varunaivibrio sulfuroxidans]|uniref:Glutathione reductase n=1 Tax=Varunaivibrio sulfuroxidans TaxID=1773489 RepID=A0A4R3J448_9PROT|nr:glutathione-disulfide reductase [Varunaivibrio sulfuroxidans]TCS60578.1 NADPH-glutathione reductase [Varunaivibrio sulfuroxidans]WES30069.1 glutathione-disulfide reductase [Varunaivibrio sulfuroxidans]
MSKYDYDLITIGAGSGGVRASRMSAQYGARVAVVEESRTGGTCVMRGCVPKKLLIYGAHYADDFADARGFGWDVAAPGFDWSSLIAAKNKELDRLEGIYQRILRENGVTLFEGRGSVVDAHTVAVGDKTYTTENILVATGGRPSLPDVPGIEHAITSNEALDLAALPEHIVIVGGGYIAVEFAGIFNALGAKVTVVIRAGNILRGFDGDVRDTLAEEMEKRGVTILRECVVRSIEKNGDTLSLRLHGTEVIEADCVMYATGRTPNTKGIGLDELGVKMNEQGALEVDDYFRASVAGVYALGDVTGRIQLTPVAINEGIALANTLFNNRPTIMDYDNIPSAVFSMPPVASVGLGESEARRTYNVDIYMSRFRPMKHTLSGRDEHSMMKLVVCRDSDRVLGCHMVGVDAPEIIQGLAVAMKCGATKAQFDATVGIHPTAAEEFVTMREKLPDHRD